jgi:hypothetical protein
MNTDAVRKLLKRECDKSGSQRKWALENNISHPFVARIINGDKEPSDRIAALLGLERVVTYRKMGQ